MVKPHKNGYLYFCADGKTYLHIIYTKRQLEIINQLKNKKLNMFSCFVLHPCREQSFKRPHESCFNCFLRKILNRELPFLFEIKIHQIWTLTDKKPFSKKLFKQVVSIAESIGWMK